MTETGTLYGKTLALYICYIFGQYDINELADIIETTNTVGIFLREASVKTMFLLCNILVCNVAKNLKKLRKLVPDLYMIRGLPLRVAKY